MLTPITENFPPELKELPRWVTWRYELPEPGHPPTKVPYNARTLNGGASSTNPRTWSTFEQAETAYLERVGDADELTGVGFVLNGDGLAGIDIDGCVIDGTPDPAALRLLNELNSAYVEISPSGNGLRGFGYAPPLDTGASGKLGDLKVEVYSTGRYLTLTGRTLKTGPLVPLVGFKELADSIRTTKKTNPETGEVLSVPQDEKHAELVRRVLSGDVFHDSLRDLAASFVVCGMKPGAAVNHLRGLMDASNAPRDERWKARRAQIPDLVSSAERKCGPVVEPGQEASQMRLVSIADVLTNPQPPHPFLWGPYIPAEALTLLSGHGGTGKSGFVLQLAVHVAMGLDFLNKPVQRAKTLFFSAEDSASILRLRVADICRNHGIDPVQLAQHLHVMDATDAAVLWQSDGPRKPGEATPNYTALQTYIDQHEIGFLSVDNASDTFGADRFDKSQVTQFVRALVRLVRARRGAALLLSHVNRTTAAPKGGRKEPSGESYSDSVAWHNAARSRLFLAGAEGGDDLTLEHEKSNYGKKGETLNLRRMEGCGFEPATQIQIGSPAQGLIDQMRLTPILTLIDEFYRRGEWISPDTHARNNAYKVLSSERGYPKVLKASDLWPLLRDAQRQNLLHAEDYRTIHRKEGKRWKVGSAPTAPTAPTEYVSAPSDGSAPTAPTGIGGMGEGARTQESAIESANDAPPVPKTRKQRTMQAQKVA